MKVGATSGWAKNLRLVLVSGLAGAALVLVLQGATSSWRPLKLPWESAGPGSESMVSQNYRVSLTLTGSSDGSDWTIPITSREGQVTFIEGSEGDALGLIPQVLRREGDTAVDIQLIHIFDRGKATQTTRTLSRVAMTPGSSVYFDLEDGDGPIKLSLDSVHIEIEAL
ncbi:MAG: hypothetical protein AAF604_11025 [Acidobacteriota bacterium]